MRAGSVHGVKLSATSRTILTGLCFSLNSRTTVSAPHQLLQYKYSVHMCGDRHVLGRELFSRSEGLRGHGHGTVYRSDCANVLESVHGRVRQFAEPASARLGEGLGGRARVPVSVGDGFGFRLFGRVQRVTERLTITDARVGQLLRDGSDLGKILQLQADAGRDLVADYFVLRGF